MWVYVVFHPAGVTVVPRRALRCHFTAPAAGCRRLPAADGLERWQAGSVSRQAGRQAEDTLKSASNLRRASHTAMVAGTEGGGGGGEEKSISSALTVF